MAQLKEDGIIVQASNLITEIFRNSLDNCEHCPSELMNTFADLLDTYAGSPFCVSFLEFFKAVLCVNGEPNNRNQLRVLAILSNRKYSSVIPDSMNGGFDHSGIDAGQEFSPEAVYRRHLMSVFAACARSAEA